MKHWYRTPANGRNVHDYGNTRLGELDARCNFWPYIVTAFATFVLAWFLIPALAASSAPPPADAPATSDVEAVAGQGGTL